MSPACTASGLIFRLSSCLRPSILTWTVPPPAVASTTVSCIFFCRFSYCCLACDISDWRLNPPMARSLLFVALIDDGSNLSAKFFLQPFHDRVLLGARTSSTIARCAGARCNRLRRSTGKHFQFRRLAQRAASGCDCEALRIGAQRHVDHRRRGRDFHRDLTAFDRPLAGLEHRDEHAMTCLAERVEHSIADRIYIYRGL